MTLYKGRKIGFTLVELVLVIVIIGILAAIAIPRLSRGSSGASCAALTANLTVVRSAINLYATEHNSDFPPGPAAADVVDQMTLYSNLTGGTQASRDTTFKYGPYLATIPPCPVGEAAGTAGASDILIDAVNSPPVPNIVGGEGWVYNPDTGEFIANTNQNDDTGKPYKEY